MPFQPEGVIPACLMPFDAELHIDREAYRGHLRDLAGVEGISAITVNGHAAEVHALSFEEQHEALELACETLAGRVPIVAGVSTSNCGEASRIARMASETGADALLVFPSEVLALGGQARPETALAHVSSIADATDLPLILFQYPLSGGLGYPLETLLMLCERIPSIVAIKDWCHDPPLHERHIRELHALDRPVKVLTTHSAWLLGSLAMGADGILSGAGSVIADLHVALWRAIQRGDLTRAREVNDAIYPTVRAFYREPLLDMHNRMKVALVRLGRLEDAHVRPPLVQLTSIEMEELEQRLEQAGLTAETVYRRTS
jgi:4-hydroxy-tetrahydrodipicolinate synthase